MTRVCPGATESPYYRRGSIRDFKGAGLEEIEDGDFATIRSWDMDHLL
jgi:hypothetical protein